MAPSEPEKGAEAQKEVQPKPENDEDPEKEIVSGNWQLPSVQLRESHDPTGEENEKELWKQRSKLFRWDRGEWRERGLGDSKLLRNSEDKIRFLLRQEKTNKVVANHYVLPVNGMCKLTPNAASDKIWIWSVLDSADVPTVQLFALKFAQVAEATKFREEFLNAAEQNLKLFDQGKFGNMDGATRNLDTLPDAAPAAGDETKSEKTAAQPEATTSKTSKPAENKPELSTTNEDKKDADEKNPQK